MGTISKALNLLSYFSESRPELGLLDLKNMTGQDKATVHRHLVELQANGFLEQNSTSRKYRLGSAILRLAAVRERTFPVRRVVAGRVNELSSECGELVHAMLIQSDGVSPLYYYDAGVGGTRVYFDEADVLPLHATSSGIVALAFGKPSLRKDTLKKERKKYTSTTITDAGELSEAIEECKRLGYAFVDETYESEVCSFAVPFFEDGELAYGTIAIAIPTSRLHQIEKPLLIDRLWQCSEVISRDLGGKIPEQVKQTWHMAA